MRRTLLFLVAAIAAAGIATSAGAAIDNTSHDVAIGVQGSCSACHIPHKSVGKRLWPANMAAQETNFGEVGALCYYCHGTGGGAGLAAAVQSNIMSITTGAYSHGLTAGDIPPGGNNLANATDLPYYNQSVIQCTTCHNVHDDTNRPFLRRSYETLCQDCHSNRNFVGGSASHGPGGAFGAWGSANVGVNNPGSHPVGTDITGNVFGGASPINFGLTTFINMVRSNAVDNWSLGGHLASGGVMCGSCHAPHGVDTDEAAPAAELYPTVNLLVFAQSTGVGPEATVANGDGDANSRMCEACHYTTATTIDAATNAAYVVTTWSVGAAATYGPAATTTYNKQPNPGGSAYTHPVDDLGARYNAGVTAFPANWPGGSSPGTNVSATTTKGGASARGPICESCHTPHPNANQARTTITAASQTPILRAPITSFCSTCHTGTMANHHPVGTGIMTARFNGASSTGGTIGNGDADLTCDDCHSGAGAHNWTGRARVGLDNDWVPADNRRGAADVVGDTGMPSPDSNDSCKQCHMNIIAGTKHQSPTKNSADGGAVVTHTWRNPSTSGYQDLGEGSHFMGDNVSNLYASGFFAGSAFNATTDIWDNTAANNTTGWGAGGWSRWYGSLGSVGCQSCHDLEPPKNVPGTALLLGYYQDGQLEATSAANDPSAFCQGCHGVTPGGGNPHPMTGSTIGRAVTAGRATTTLITGAGAYIDPAAPTRNPGTGSAGTSTFAGTDMMNCDSCHQPHDAATAGGTYIYEAPAANVTATTAPVLNPTTNQPGRGSTAVGLQDMNFCNQCHAY